MPSLTFTRSCLVFAGTAALAALPACGGDDAGDADTAPTSTQPGLLVPGEEGPAEVDLAVLAVFEEDYDELLGAVPADAGNCAATAAEALGVPLAPAGDEITAAVEGDVVRIQAASGLTWLVTPPAGPEPGAQEPYALVSVIGGSVVVAFERDDGNRVVARLDAEGLDQAVLLAPADGELDPACPDVAAGAEGILAVVPGDDGVAQLARWDWST